MANTINIVSYLAASFKGPIFPLPHITHFNGVHLNKLLSLVGESLETLDITIKGLHGLGELLDHFLVSTILILKTAQDQISLKSPSHLHRCVIRWSIDRLHDNELEHVNDPLGFLSTLKPEAFDTCIIMLPLNQVHAHLYKTIIRELWRLPTGLGYVDMMFGSPDPESPLGPLGQVTLENSKKNEESSSRRPRYRLGHEGIDLYIGNQFDNREIFR